MSLFNKWFSLPSQLRTENHSVSVSSSSVDNTVLTGSIVNTETELRSRLGNSVDLRIQKVRIGGRDGLLGYLESMVDKKLLSEQLTRILHSVDRATLILRSAADLEQFATEAFGGTPYKFTRQFHDLTQYLLSGFVMIHVQELELALLLQMEQITGRHVNEPSTQTIIRGPKEGFTESIQINTALLRHRLKNSKLRFEQQTIGEATQSSVNIAYIQGLANPSIVTEVRNRLSRIQTMGVFDSGSLEELIEDKTLTPFPTIYNTERPDTVAAHLAQGKVALLVDGSPFVLTVPAVLGDFFVASEDYYQRSLMASLVRLVRYLSFLINLILPSAYIAVINFHQEMLPTTLLISIASQREGVPFPGIVEILLMEITFEIIREAGIRMPRAVGQTVSIVGALVIGQAAVEAGFVSNALIIVVAFTALSSFVSPVYSFAVASRILRFMLTILAAIFGMYGILLGLVLMVAHLASLRSFGAPYLASFAPFNLEAQKDLFIRVPYFMLKRRPSYLRSPNPLMPNSPSPSPSSGKGSDGEET